jgi:hypothetical protein
MIEQESYDVEVEVKFRTNPHYIFHISGGFETKGNLELEKIKLFLENRSNAVEKDQVHVIWYYDHKNWQALSHLVF